MSSPPPATSPSQVYPANSASNTQSLSVRFGAETSAIIRDKQSGNCDLALKMPILQGSTIDRLLVDGTISERDGITLLRTKENNVAGCCVIPVTEGGLSRASQTIYDSLFRILDASPELHLYRVWNYVPFINLETNGMENYRHFNVGRWDAFRSRYGNHCKPNMPAASAVGIDESKIAIAFLAGTAPVSYIENPEQVPAYDYPSAYGPRPPSFSRCALIKSPNATAYLSGTASVKGHATVASNCLDSQLNTTIDNIDIIRKQLNVPCSGVTTSWRAYVRESSDAPRTQETLCNSLSSCTPDNLTIVQASICRARLRVEVEGMFEWSD